MQLMAKSVIERVIDAEMNVHLGRQRAANAAAADGDESAERPPRTVPNEASSTADKRSSSGTKRGRNRRNDRSSKIIRGDLGEVRIATPRHAMGPRRKLRAATGAQASASDGGLQREDSRPPRQGNEHSRHLDRCQSTSARNGKKLKTACIVPARSG